MSDFTLNPDILSPLLDEHRENLDRFTELLIAENQKYNLTRIDSPEQIRVRHYLDSLAGLPVLDELSQEAAGPFKILDIGSGAGFPGLVLAIVRPQWHITSLEATEKKARFQKMVCQALGLDNVTVIHVRAEAAAHHTAYRERFDAVTARALAPMPMLAELSLGFVKTGGLGLYWKGPAASEEALTALPAVTAMAAHIVRVIPYTLQIQANESAALSLVVCRKTHATPKSYPRTFGIIKKQPLS